MSDLLPAKPYFGRAEISPPASISGDRPDGALRAIEDAGEDDKTATEAVTRNFATRAIAGRDRAKDLLTAATWNSVARKTRKQALQIVRDEQRSASGVTQREFTSPTARPQHRGTAHDKLGDKKLHGDAQCAFSV